MIWSTWLQPVDWIVLALNVTVAIGASFASGYWAHRLPPERLLRDGPVLRLRSFEAGGAIYERRLGIRRWKARLPEAGAFFRGGVSKSHLPGRDRASLERFVIETRRAERAHWVALVVVTTVPAAWNSLIGIGVMVVYGLAANLPCIIVQRYNRARLLSLTRRFGSASSDSAGDRAV